QVVPFGPSAPEPVDTPGGQLASGDDLVQQGLRVLVQVPRGGAHLRVVEDGREAAAQLPGMEEEGPVDVLAEHLQPRLHDPGPGELRHRQVAEVEAGTELA